MTSPRFVSPVIGQTSGHSESRQVSAPGVDLQAMEALASPVSCVTASSVRDYYI